MTCNHKILEDVLTDRRSVEMIEAVRCPRCCEVYEPVLDDFGTELVLRPAAHGGGVSG